MGRQIPDVAAYANPGTTVCNSTLPIKIACGGGGTSEAAPIWASAWAIASQAKGAPVPAYGTIYDLAASDAIHSFNDFRPGSTFAQVGLGSPDIARLASWVAGEPTVTSVDPSTGPAAGGQTITIKGTNFIDVHAVSINYIPVESFTVDSASRITAKTPRLAAGPIYVTTPAGKAIGGEYSPYPIITGVSPPSGPIRGGTIVTVSGMGMPTGSAIGMSFGGVAVSADCSGGDDKCGVLSPPAPKGKAGGVDVTINGSAPVSADKFDYTGPVIIALSPSRGSSAGGTTVAVDGNGFSSNMKVTFGSKRATAVSGSCSLGSPQPQPGSDFCLFFSPAGAGSVHVAADVDGDKSAPSGADLFTYIAPPAGTLSPRTGPMTGGTPLTLTGSNFSTTPGGTVVQFGYLSMGVNITATCASATVCQLVTPEFGFPGAAFVASVYVTANGIGAELPGGFTFTPVAGEIFSPPGSPGSPGCPVANPKCR
jgi:hypothetical protein